MKRRWAWGISTGLVLVALLSFAGCSSGGSGSGNTGGGTPTGSAKVVAKNFAFSPSTVDVTVGGSVTWTNEDAATHNVEGDGGISSGKLASGASYTKTFDTAGTYNYKCIIHPTMTGTVVVK